MTGFGHGSSATLSRIVSIEMKTLNSKQLDLIIKLPGRYRCLEGELRNLVASRVERGKIEVIAGIELTGQDVVSLLNVDLLKQYKAQIEELDKVLGIPAPQDWHSVLLRMPDAMRGEDQQLTEDEKSAFFKAAEESLDSLEKFRIEEGAKLYDFFVSKIERIRSLLAEVAPHEEGRIAKIRSRITEQLSKLAAVEIDNGRLEQELIYYIEKLDISEEKQRLTSHLDYFVKTMGDRESGDPTPKGKKLGFIAQEMGREINTLGSKSNNAEMQIIVVKMKDELEQIKEQVLNVL